LSSQTGCHANFSSKKRSALGKGFIGKKESNDMGKCTRTVGERRLGRTIYKLGNSVELSSKEGKAKIAQDKIKQKTQTEQGFDSDSPVENIRDPANGKKKQPTQQ
jgi:hypothetical protein